MLLCAADYVPGGEQSHPRHLCHLPAVLQWSHEDINFQKTAKVQQSISSSG